MLGDYHCESLGFCMFYKRALTGLFHTIFSRMFSTENSVIIQEKVSLFRAKVVLNTVLKIYIVSPTKAEGRHDYCPLQFEFFKLRDTLLHHNPLCGFYVPQIMDYMFSSHHHAGIGAQSINLLILRVLQCIKTVIHF